MAHRMDLLTDQEIVTARAVPKVMPPRTDSVTFDAITDLAMFTYEGFLLVKVCNESIVSEKAVLDSSCRAGSQISRC
jgi:hypothetical protein